MLVAVLQQQRPIVVMLDHDRAGAKGAARIAKQLSLLGVQHSVAVPHRDPKYLTKQDIVTCIESSAPWACPWVCQLWPRRSRRPGHEVRPHAEPLDL